MIRQKVGKEENGWTMMKIMARVIFVISRTHPPPTNYLRLTLTLWTT